MVVERTKTEIIIRLPASVNVEDLQDFLNYARYKKLTSGYTTEQTEADKLSQKINKEWWKKSKGKFIN